MESNENNIAPVGVIDAIADLRTFEKQLADQYAKQGFQNATEAYLALRPEVQRTTAQVNASKILTSLPVKLYLDELSRTSPADIKSAKRKFVAKVARITDKAEQAEQFGAALKGCELEAKVEGLFSQDENDGAQYLQFFDKVSIVVNQGNPVDNAKVIDGEISS